MNDQDAPDEELVRLAQQGDTDALNELVRRHYRAWQQHAVRLWPNNPTEAEDVVQSALLRAIEKLPEIPQPSRFRRWVEWFIYYEVKAQRKFLKKDGTKIPLDDNEQVEDLTVESSRNERLRELFEQFYESLKHMDQTCQTVGKVMIEDFDRWWPSVRFIAGKTGISTSTVQRCKEHILSVWRQIAERNGFSL